MASAVPVLATSATAQPSLAEHRPGEVVGADKHFRYDAFLSYSWRVDSDLAQALQRGLHRFAKPWWQVRALDVFRDKENQAVGEGLSRSLREALESSKFLVLLASPEAAASAWVQQEAALWRARALPPDRVLIVLTSGTLVWDADRARFDSTRSSALPAPLLDAFDEEPLWFDFSGAGGGAVRLASPAFTDLLASLAARIRGVSKAELVSVDALLHRRAQRLRRLAVASIAAFAMLAAGAAWLAFAQRNEALQAQSRFLANASAQELRAGHPALAARLALAGLPNRASPAEEAGESAFKRLRGWLSATLVDRPWNAQAEAALARALQANHERLVLPAMALNATALSADARRIATADEDGRIFLWSASTGALLHTLSGYRGRVGALAFSPDGSTLASASRDGLARLWDVAAGREIGFVLHEGHEERLDFLADGRALVLSNRIGAAGTLLWERGAATARPMVKLEPGESVAWFDAHCQLAVSVLRANAMQGLAAHRLDAEGGAGSALVRRLRLSTRGQPPLPTDPLAVAPDCRHVLLTSSSAEAPPAQLWNLEAGSFQPVGEPGQQHTSAAFSPDGKRLALGTAQGQLMLWDTVSRSKIAALEGHSSTVADLVFTPDGARLLSASHDGRVRLWDGHTGVPLGELAGHEAVAAVVLSADGRKALSRGLDGTARLWNLPPLPHPARLARGDSAQPLALSRDGVRVYGLADDSTLRAWDAASGQVLYSKAMTPHRDARPPWIKFGAGARYSAAWVFGGAEVELVDLDGPGPPRKLPVGREVESVAFSPDERLLATADGTGRIEVWEVATGNRLVSDLEAQVPGSREIGFVDNERLMAVGRAGRVTVAEARTGRVERVFSLRQPELPMLVEPIPPAVSVRAGQPPGEGVRVWGLADGVNPAGRVRQGDLLLAWNGQPFRAQDWEQMQAALGVGQVVRLSVLRGGERFEEPVAAAEREAFGRIAAVHPLWAAFGAKYDERLEIWDHRGGRRLGRVGEPHVEVTAAAFSSSGTLLALAGAQEGPMLWIQQVQVSARTTIRLPWVEEILDSYSAHTPAPHYLEFFDEDRRLLVAAGRNVAVISVDSGEVLARWSVAEASSVAARLDKPGQRVYISSSSGALQVHPLPSRGAALVALAREQLPQPLSAEERSRYFLAEKR